MFQKSPIALVKAQADNTSANLLNKTHQIIIYLYWANCFNKKVYNNLMNSIQNGYYT